MYETSQVWMASTQVTLATAADVQGFRIGPNPIRPIRWGWIVTGAVDATQNLITKLDYTPYTKTGSASGRTDGFGGFNLTIDSDRVKGSIVYVTVGGDADSTSLDATGGIILKPGDILVWQVTQPATAGDAFAFLEYQNLGFDPNGVLSEFSDEDGTAASLLKLVNGAIAI